MVDKEMEHLLDVLRDCVDGNELVFERVLEHHFAGDITVSELAAVVEWFASRVPEPEQDEVYRDALRMTAEFMERALDKELDSD